MSSALDARPALVEGVRIVRREHRGDVHYIVKPPGGGKYFRFGEVEVALMRAMDGARTPAGVAGAAAAEAGVTAEPGQVADFAQRLKRMGIVERTPAERHLMLMERIRAKRRLRARGRTEGTLLRLTWSIGDPDRLFDRWAPRLAWLWTPGFVAVSCALFAVYLGVLTAGRDAFLSGLAGMVTVSGFGVVDYALFYGIFVVVGAVHELGHGLTTKRFGGEVHQIGVMLLYFSPALFCNTNDAWTFRRRSRRLWVTFAGPWIQLVLASLAAVVWALTEPGTAVNRVAFLAVLVGGISSVLANANPFLPLDGYFALSDWLEIPNLRKRSFAYCGALVRRHLLRLGAEVPVATPRERRIFLLYGGLAALYTAFALAFSVWLFGRLLHRFIGPWAWVVGAVVAARAAYGLSGRARALWSAALSSVRGLGRRLRARPRAVGLAGGALAVGGLVLLLPWTARAPGAAHVEAYPRAEIRAPVAGVLDRLHAGDGDTVAAGALLAELWNPELEEEAVALRSRLQRLRTSAGRARAGERREEAALRTAEAAELVQELAMAEARVASLRLRAPIAGVFSAPRISERPGARLEEGALLGVVGSADGRVARVRVPPNHAADVAAGRPAGLKFGARPDLTFRSRVTRVSPAVEEEGWLEAEIPIPVPDGGWRPPPGTVGRAKILTERRSVGAALLRAVGRTLRLDLGLWL